MARARRRRNSVQGQLLDWTGRMGSHAKEMLFRPMARAGAAGGDTEATYSKTLHGPVMAGHTKVHKQRGKRGTPKERARRFVRMGPPQKGKAKYGWMDADGNEITGKRWASFHRAGLTLGGKRKKKAKPAARRRKKSGSKARGRKKGGRTAAQRAATKRMIAANRRARGGKGRRSSARRRMPSKGLMRVVIGKMRRGVTFKVRGTKKRRGYTLKSAGRGRVPTRKQMRSALRGMPRKRVIVSVQGSKKRRGYTIRNPRGGSIMARQNPGRRRRRNPGMDLMGTAKRTIAAAIPAVAAGAITSLIDAKFLGDRPQGVRIGVKILEAGAVAVLLRSRPNTAAIMMGAILGSLGAELGTKLSGGLVTANKAATVQALGTLLREDPAAMSALIDPSGRYSSVPSLSGFETMQDVNLG
jgi:hypothetical protein